MKLSSRKKILLGVFLLVVLASASFYEIGYVVAQSLSNRATISSGPYSGSTTYTIYSFGTTYYAKDAYGSIAYSSSNPSTVINAAVAASPSTGLSVIDGGGLVYPIATGILLKAHVKLQNFNFSVTANGISAITLSNCWFTYLDNIAITSSTGTQKTAGCGINITGDTWELHFNQIYCELQYDGLYLSPTTSRLYNLFADQITFWNIKNDALFLNNLAGAVINGLTVWGADASPITHTQHGIYWTFGYGLFINHGDLMGCENAFAIDPPMGFAAKDAVISDLAMDSSQNQGLLFGANGGYFARIRFDNPWASTNYGYGIQMFSVDNLTMVSFNNPIILNNGLSGVYCNSGNDIQFNGGYCMANCYRNTGVSAEMQGIYFTAANITIQNMRVSNKGEVYSDLTVYTGFQEYGIYYDGGSIRAAVKVCDLTGGGTTKGLYNATALSLYGNDGEGT